MAARSSKSALEIDHQTGRFHLDQSKLTLMMWNTYYSVSIGHGMLRAAFCYFIFSSLSLYFQAGYEFRNDMAPTPQILAEKLEKSPMSHVKKVRKSLDCFSRLIDYVSCIVW